MTELNWTRRPRRRRRNSFDDQSGQTLAIGVLAVLLLAATLALGTLQIGPRAGLPRQQSVAKQLPDTLQQALRVFAARNYRLPCPATPTSSGIEQNSCSSQGANSVVPWKTLGLQKSDAVDSWGNLVGYAVSAGLVSGTPYQNAASVSAAALHGAGDALTVTDNLSGTPCDGGKCAYVLISYGPNGKGAYLSSGSQRPAGTGTREAANNAAGAFGGSTSFVVWPYDDGKLTAANLFDDVLAYEDSVAICANLNGAKAGLSTAPYCTAQSGGSPSVLAAATASLLQYLPPGNASNYWGISNTSVSANSSALSDFFTNHLSNYATYYDFGDSKSSLSGSATATGGSYQATSAWNSNGSNQLTASAASMTVITSSGTACVTDTPDGSGSTTTYGLADNSFTYQDASWKKQTATLDSTVSFLGQNTGGTCEPFSGPVRFIFNNLTSTINYLAGGIYFYPKSSAGTSDITAPSAVGIRFLSNGLVSANLPVPSATLYLCYASAWNSSGVVPGAQTLFPALYDGTNGGPYNWCDGTASTSNGTNTANPMYFTTQISMQPITSVTVTSRGSGYTAPKIAFSGGGGTGAAAAAAIGGVRSVAIAPNTSNGYAGFNQGINYTPELPPSVYFSGGGGGNATATTTVANGSVTWLDTNQWGGSNYTAAPTVTIPAASTCPAPYAVANVKNGAVTGISVVRPGGGFRYGAKYAQSAVPIVSISGGGGSGATAVVDIDSSLKAIHVTSPGSGYSSAPTVTIDGTATAVATISNGQVTGINVTNPGSGYSSAPTVTLSGGGASVAATAAATLGDGISTTVSSVRTIYLTNGGSGYTSAPTVTLGGNAANAATATASIDTDSGKVTAVTVTGSGAGYSEAPTIAFSGGGGSGAAAIASLGGITVTNGGSGYAGSPTVTFTGSGIPKAATASAAISGGTVSAVYLTDGGTCYSSAPTASFASGNANAFGTGIDGVGGVTMVNAGYGFTSAPAVTVNPATKNYPATSYAAGLQAITAAPIANIGVTAQGSGYSLAGGAGTTVPVTISGGGGSGASATATIGGGGILAINLISGGTGYSAPIVSLPCSQAAAVASVDLDGSATGTVGAISGITVVNGGLSCSGGSVTISGGGGSGAAATATATGDGFTAIDIFPVGASRFYVGGLAIHH